MSIFKQQGKSTKNCPNGSNPVFTTGSALYVNFPFPGLTLFELALTRETEKWQTFFNLARRVHVVGFTLLLNFPFPRLTLFEISLTGETGNS